MYSPKSETPTLATSAWASRSLRRASSIRPTSRWASPRPRSACACPATSPSSRVTDRTRSNNAAASVGRCCRRRSMPCQKLAAASPSKLFSCSYSRRERSRWVSAALYVPVRDGFAQDLAGRTQSAVVAELCEDRQCPLVVCQRLRMTLTEPFDHSHASHGDGRTVQVTGVFSHLRRLLIARQGSVKRTPVYVLRSPRAGGGGPGGP